MPIQSESETTFKPSNRVKRVAHLLYAAIGLEILFMISPAGLYFYTGYGPVLDFLNRWPATAWLTQFFLPHLSTTRSVLLNAVPWVGGIAIVTGIGLFFVAAAPLYRAKISQRGMVATGPYRHFRHPQYLGLAVLGFGALLVWPRFLVLLAYVSMLLMYRSLAAHEERRCEARFGASYRKYLQRTTDIFPLSGCSLVTGVTAVILCLVLAFAVREYALANITASYQTHVVLLSPARLSDWELLAAYGVACGEAGVEPLCAGDSEAALIVHVVPQSWRLADLPLDSQAVQSGHDTPADFDRHRYQLLFSRPRSHKPGATGKDILRSAYGLSPLRLVEVDIESGAAAVSVPPQNVHWGDIPTPLF